MDKMQVIIIIIILKSQKSEQINDSLKMKQQ